MSLSRRAMNKFPMMSIFKCFSFHSIFLRKKIHICFWIVVKKETEWYWLLSETFDAAFFPINSQLSIGLLDLETFYLIRNVCAREFCENLFSLFGYC